MPNPQTHDPDPNKYNRVPLHNLSLIRTGLDSIHHRLSQSINTNTPLTNHQFTALSNDVVSSIHHLILNATAIVSSAANFTLPPQPAVIKPSLELKTEVREDCEIVELDAIELLAEHTHFCDICGKGFRRDVNLRMHMRAHGNRFKTLEALSKPLTTVDNGVVSSTRRRGGVSTRFSCPFEGCNRNKGHKKFKALKSIVCVKNHFKRSHCPKIYSCNRCHKKNFSVLSDLRSHMKQCGEFSKWKCSCGTTFSRKDKLFGHIALFEGHMPALAVDEDEKGKKVIVAAAEVVKDSDEEEEDPISINDNESGACLFDDDNWFFDDLDKFDGFTPLDFPSI
ncbi:unnamed protein product [Lupinus luteus]|uniref:C2H2-type domain-containing protein n=1 Tax=Lupinus luteus TaxID=3873 RepID=A0AAV1XF53_LUPLU